jgi:competence protein ComEA
MPALWHRVRSGEDPVAFGAVVIVLGLGAGLVWFWMGTRHGGVPPASAAPGVVADASSQPHAASGGTTTSTGSAVTVHVAGAVARPGLLHLPAGSRVADALAAAGGGVPRADLDRLNLAARLTDGQKVWVTRRGEPALPDPAGQGPVGGAGAGNPGPPELVEPIDLNAADLAALDSLPGIGPGTARAILDERTRRGGFRSTRDLLRVPGIGETRFARLKDRVRV